MGKQPKTVRVKGKVFSGKGEGSKFIELPWVKSQIKEKLGFTPAKGTLNLMLNGNCPKIREALTKTKPILIMPAPGYCRGRCFKAYVMGLAEGAIVIPEIHDYPENVLEVIAPVNLRERFGLKDGDLVEISVIIE